MQHQIEEGYTKAMMQFVKLAAKWGAKPVQTTGKHLKFRDNLGNQISAPKTSSDFRAIRNFKSELKNRGFVQQLPTSKVKAAKLDATKPPVETVTPSRQTANQQTTFKDFMDRIRPVLTDVKRPETTATRYERGWRKALKDLPASEKFRVGDDIIRQLRREEYIDEALLPSLVRATARQIFKNKALTQKVGSTLKQINLPRTTTGFQTGRGSKYTFKQNPKEWGKTQRTAINDPTHPTKAGVKQQSDFTMFTTPSAGVEMKARFVYDGRTKDFYKGLPRSPVPKKGRAAVEVWNKYEGGGRAMHNSNPITDLQTKGRSALPLYGQQRRELQQRVRTALRNPKAQEILRRDIKQGNNASINNLYRQRNNPQNPNTLENELKGRYRGKGVGRKETTYEQIAPMKSTLLGPNLESLPHIDSRGPGKKLLSIMNLKKGMDSTGRTPYKVP